MNGETWGHIIVAAILAFLVGLIFVLWLLWRDAHTMSAAEAVNPIYSGKPGAKEK